MYQYNYPYQPTYYGAGGAMSDNLAQLRMNTTQMQNAAVQPSMPSQPMQAQQPTNGFIWVQGEAGAKSCFVAADTTVMLMDSEGDRFYLKSADASGKPLPLRIFDYKERAILTAAEPKAPTSDFSEMGNIFVTREEFERTIASISSGCKCKELEKNKLTEDAENGEQLV